MVHPTSQREAQIVLNNFINSDLINYKKFRSYDYGPQHRHNVSCLSPYITHRLLFEFKVIKQVLEEYPYESVHKFIDEIFWRIYWRGWLEQKPTV